MEGPWMAFMINKTEALAWAILNVKTQKLVGGPFPQLFKTQFGAICQVAGRNEYPVRVRVIPVLKNRRLGKR